MLIRNTGDVATVPVDLSIITRQPGQTLLQSSVQSLSANPKDQLV